MGCPWGRCWRRAISDEPDLVVLAPDLSPKNINASGSPPNRRGNIHIARPRDSQPFTGGSESTNALVKRWSSSMQAPINVSCLAEPSGSSDPCMLRLRVAGGLSAQMSSSFGAPARSFRLYSLAASTVSRRCLCLSAQPGYLVSNVPLDPDTEARFWLWLRKSL